MPHRHTNHQPAYNAHETEIILAYLAQEGLESRNKADRDSAMDMLAGLDKGRILDFLNTTLLERRGQIDRLLEQDPRPVIREALQNAHYAGVLQEKDPAIIRKEGPKMLAQIIHQSRGRDLREEEITAITRMAYYIPSVQLLDEVLPFALRYPQVAYALIENQVITKKHLESLVHNALEARGAESKGFLAYLIRMRMGMLFGSPAILRSLRAHGYGHLIEEVSGAAPQNGHANGKKRRKTTDDRRAERAEAAGRKAAHEAVLWRRKSGGKSDELERPHRKQKQR